MEVPAPSGLLRPLATIVVPIARKLCAEKRAGQNPFSIHPEQDPLDQQLEAALGRLGSIDANKAFWLKLLTQIGAAYTRPEFFEMPSVQEWLSDKQVKSDFKALARTRLIGVGTDVEGLNRIRDKYSEATGEASHRATYAILVVLAVLQVSAHAALTPGEGVIAGMLRDTATENRESFEIIGAKLDHIAPAEDPLYGEKLSEELAKILSRRAIPGTKPADEIEALMARVENGDLSRAPAADKAEAYYWAARILAPDVDKAARARIYLEAYQALPNVEPDKVAFVEGWLKKADGQTQDAIDILSIIDSPDARASLFVLILERDGKTAALAWLKDHRPYDHTLLSTVGWRNAVIAMAEDKQWQEAVDHLDAIPKGVQESFPEFLFIKGILHAGFLLPEPIRLRLLGDSNIDFKAEVQEGENASRHRKQAMEALQQAHKLLLQFGAEKRARGCDYHLMWIRLTAPEERDAALVELKEGMKDGEFAAFMLDIALNIDDTFDREPLERYLRRRKREGREVPQDHAARLRLLQHFGTPGEVLSHLEDEASTLKEILTPETLTSIKILALLDDERVADAEKELEQCSDIFSEEYLERHRLMFADRKGEELEKLEALYLRTKDYGDLLNLVLYLERTHQWASLIPYAQALLATRRSARGLRTIIHAMQQTGVPKEDIVACLDEYQDLIVSGTRDGDELLLSKGWGLFGLGRFTEAHEIANDLAIRNHEPDAIALEINLALRTGQWEHFTTIIDREFPRLKGLPSRLLLHMASVVADWDQDRAIEILGIAAEKDPEDGAIQANAYWLASQIGREIEATTWLERVMRLAGQGEGPAQPATLREIVEMMPARAERRREWNRQYSTGEIGVHPAASLLNVPIAHLLVGESLRNESEIDPRRRSVIPVRHGGRGLVDLTGKRSLAFDLTSLLVFENLEVLESVFATIERIYLSPRLMNVLFIEHRQVRFHQPSIVEEAKRIRDLIADGVIQLLRNAHPPKELVDEVGDEMASLLHMAQTNNGRVLSTLPVHKAGSLDQEDADLGEHGPLVLKTTQFLPHIEGQVSPETYARAHSFLASVDRGEELGSNELGEGPLYIDNLALKYLDTAGVLQNISHLGRDIFVADSVNTDAKSLIDAARHGIRVADVIDRLRKRIRDSIQAGKVTFLPEFGEREDQEAFLRINALQDVIANAGEADAVCLDDRAIGKHANMTDQHGRTVPLVGSIDVLEHLAAQGSITADKKSTCDFRLRKGGFAFLPLRTDTVLAALKASVDAERIQFTENRDLVSIRENLQRIRSMNILRLPEEVAWFSQMAQTTRQLLAQIWEDATIGLGMAEKMSDWVLDVLSPLPTAWRESILLARDEDIEEPTKFALLQIINTGLTIRDADRMEAFAKWAERRLIKPLLPANASLVDEISQFLGSHIAKIATEIADEFE